MRERSGGWRDDVRELRNGVEGSVWVRDVEPGRVCMMVEMACGVGEVIGVLFF